MPVIQVQDEFQSGDNVTASSLNDLVNDASFVSGAVDNSTLQVASAGHLKVKDNGILSSHLKSDALIVRKVSFAVCFGFMSINDLTSKDELSFWFASVSQEIYFLFLLMA